MVTDPGKVDGSGLSRISERNAEKSDLPASVPDQEVDLLSDKGRQSFSILKPSGTGSSRYVRNSMLDAAQQQRRSMLDAAQKRRSTARGSFFNSENRASLLAEIIQPQTDIFKLRTKKEEELLARGEQLAMQKKISCRSVGSVIQRRSVNPGGRQSMIAPAQPDWMGDWSQNWAQGQQKSEKSFFQAVISWVPGMHSEQNDPDARDRKAKRKKMSVRSLHASVAESLEDRLNFSHVMGSELLKQRFENFMGMVILVNCMMIGLEASCHAGTSCNNTFSGMFSLCEHIFLCMYILELLARFYAFGVRESMASNWIRFDCFLVASGIISTWVLAPFFADGSARSILVMKVLRIVRLARAMRLVVQFRDLWILVRGLLSSGLIMMWSIALIFVLIFVFAVIGIELIGTNGSLLENEQVGEVARKTFGTLGNAMLTLSSFWLVDNVDDVYLPLIRHQPYLALYFLAFILVVSVSCMNLVTAIMVQNAIGSAQQDKEAAAAWERHRRRELVPKLIQMFQMLDKDGSGDLTKQELADSSPEVSDMLKKVGNIRDLLELFDVLDVDGSGSIEIDEFCAGMLKQSSDPDKPIEILRMGKQLDRMLKLTGQVLAKFQRGDGDGPALRESKAGLPELRNVQQLCGDEHLPKACEDSVKEAAQHYQHTVEEKYHPHTGGEEEEEVGAKSKSLMPKPFAAMKRRMSAMVGIAPKNIEKPLEKRVPSQTSSISQSDSFSQSGNSALLESASTLDTVDESIAGGMLPPAESNVLKSSSTLPPLSESPRLPQSARQKYESSPPDPSHYPVIGIQEASTGSSQATTGPQSSTDVVSPKGESLAGSPSASSGEPTSASSGELKSPSVSESAAPAVKHDIEDVLKLVAEGVVKALSEGPLTKLEARFTANEDRLARLATQLHEAVEWAESATDVRFLQSYPEEIEPETGGSGDGATGGSSSYTVIA